MMRRRINGGAKTSDVRCTAGGIEFVAQALDRDVDVNMNCRVGMGV